MMPSHKENCVYCVRRAQFRYPGEVKVKLENVKTPENKTGENESQRDTS